MTNLTYEQLHRENAWAYGERPDAQLVEALAGLARGRALDLAGGQGRHAVFLSSQGFDVELVDLSEEALAQASQAAARLGVPLRTVRSNLAFYEPAAGLQAAVAALALHVPARHASLAAAARLGEALNPGGLLYLSLPGFTEDTQGHAHELLEAAGCHGSVVRHVVTREERPRLPVPRRNETRALGFRR